MSGPTSSTSTVELAGVGKRYGRTRALVDIDLTFDHGVTGLLGPNGAGKTTLLRIVATSIAADAGEVRLLGRDPHRSHADVTDVRRELGYLPQELGYPSDMTAFGFVEYVAVLKEWKDRERRAQEVRRVLDVVDLDRPWRPSGSNRCPAGSGDGSVWRRRCSASPRVLVLDEPTTGLDPEQRADLRVRSPPSGTARPCCSRPTRPRTSPRSASEWWCSTGGTVRFDGAVTDLVGTAVGRVWLADEPGDGALVSWRTGTGRHHIVGGTPPAGASPAEPTLEDAYLLMLGLDARRVRAPA